MRAATEGSLVEGAGAQKGPGRNLESRHPNPTPGGPRLPTSQFALMRMENVMTSGCMDLSSRPKGDVRRRDAAKGNNPQRNTTAMHRTIFPQSGVKMAMKTRRRNASDARRL